MRVIVIGAGVVGCATALALAERGLSPLVLERSVPGAQASSVAAGILAPWMEAEGPGAALELGVRGRELYVALSEQLRETLAIDIGFRRSGLLALAFGEAEDEALRARATLVSAAGGNRELLSADEARAIEPKISEAVSSALALPEEAQVEPPLLLRALALAAERAGAQFRSGAYVRGIEERGGSVRAVLVGDERLEAERVVVAAGSWSGLVPGAGRAAREVRPIRGQILESFTRPPCARRLLFGAGGYVVPRPDGRVLVGATSEEVGFRAEVTLGGLRSLIEIGTRLCPSLEEAPVVGHRVNFRPHAPDGLPVIGETEVESVWVAGGHYRNGILLAPITAALIADCLVGTRPELSLEPFSPARFGGDR